jgi:IS1 family transposase
LSNADDLDGYKIHGELVDETFGLVCYYKRKGMPESFFAKRTTKTQETLIGLIEKNYKTIQSQYKDIFLQYTEIKDGLPRVIWKKEMETWRYLKFETYDLSFGLELQNRIVRQRKYLEREIWGLLISTTLGLAGMQD